MAVQIHLGPNLYLGSKSLLLRLNADASRQMSRNSKDAAKPRPDIYATKDDRLNRSKRLCVASTSADLDAITVISGPPLTDGEPEA